MNNNIVCYNSIRNYISILRLAGLIVACTECIQLVHVAGITANNGLENTGVYGIIYNSKPWAMTPQQSYFTVLLIF